MGIYDFIIKTVIFYIILIIILRLLGKREVGEISVFDLVILLIVADIATLAINDDWGMVIPAILSLFSLLILQKLLAFISLKFSGIRKIIDYSPSIIIYDGRLNLKEMKKQKYTVEDLLYQARGKGVMDLTEIKMAILEPTGQLSVYPKDEFNKQVLPVLISGKIEKANLTYLNLDIEKVNEYLAENRLMLSDVKYLSSDGKKFYLMESL